MARPKECPYCYREVDPAECDIITLTETDDQGNFVVIKSAQDRQKGGIFRGKQSVSLDGREMTEKLAALQCPGCKKPLPHRFEEIEQFIIAIIGDVGSGKSHYIAALINELKREAGQKTIRYARFSAASPEIEDRYQADYYIPLFKKKHQLPHTSVATETMNYPLIYQMRLLGKSSHDSVKTIYLLFYDAAGEDYKNQVRMVQYSRYVLRASAIIILADPLSMPGIVDALPPEQQPDPDSLSSFTPSERAYQIIETFERAKSLPEGSLLETPVAITISKADLLEYVGGLGHNYTFLQKPTYQDKLSDQLFQKVNDEVKELLQQHGDSGLLHLSEEFVNTCFFAISATGSSPDDQGNFNAIKSNRCLDPLFWILWKLGVTELV